MTKVVCWDTLGSSMRCIHIPCLPQNSRMTPRDRHFG